jgi:hypothetical protein
LSLTVLTEAHVATSFPRTAEGGQRSV